MELNEKFKYLETRLYNKEKCIPNYEVIAKGIQSNIADYLTDDLIAMLKFLIDTIVGDTYLKVLYEVSLLPEIEITIKK